MKKLVTMLAGVVLLVMSGATVSAQAPVAASIPVGAGLSPDQLDQLVGPIALYPDPLIAEILPAATFPSEIVLADRYVGQGGDPSQIANQGWDPSVQAMAHYPNVLKWMDDNLPWTTQLGQAFQNQQADVMNAIQQMRAKAQGLGNLPSTAQESVVTDDGDIEIEPTDPDEMYVPEYQPDQIYYQSGIFCTYPYWLPLGGWLVYDWNWHGHGLFAWGDHSARPGNWWRQTPAQRRAFFGSHSLPTWQAGAHFGETARSGWQRGFATHEGSQSFARPSAAPTIINVRPAPIDRQPAVIRRAEAPRVEAPRAEAPREEFHSAPAAGLFGGQSGREAVESSSRGQESRASMGGGGGGGGRHR
jgi:hypothetical protein